MVTRNLAGQPWQTLAWNDDHRLASVKEGANVVAEFVYGLDDTRLRRKTGDTYVYYHADGTEYTWDNTTNTGVFTYYHQMAGRTVAYTKSDSGVTTWMHADQVNSTSVTRDQTGTASTQRYTPWGELRTDGNLGTDRHFTGQVADQSTGLAFYNARYYDPVTGRFVSPDTIVPDPGDGQFLNRYSYVNNRPIVWNDPTGHCPPNVRHAIGCAQGYDPTWDSSDWYANTQRPTVAQIEGRCFAFCQSQRNGASAWPRASSEEKAIPQLSPEAQAVIDDFVGLGGKGWREEVAHDEFMRCNLMVDMPCGGSSLVSRLDGVTSEEALRQLADDYWTIGSTTVAVVCVASTAGACTKAVIVVAAGNTAISANEDIVLPLSEGRDACFGQFIFSAASNAASVAGGPAASTVGHVDVVVVTNSGTGIAQWASSNTEC